MGRSRERLESTTGIGAGEIDEADTASAVTPGPELRGTRHPERRSRGSGIG